MGRKRDLTSLEKDQIVKLLSNQKTTIEIAKMLSRDQKPTNNQKVCSKCIQSQK